MASFIQVATYGSITTLCYEDSEAARLSYEKVSSALNDYKLFKNDRSETVEIVSDNEITTLRLEKVETITLCNSGGVLADIKHKLELEKFAHDERLRLGLLVRKASAVSGDRSQADATEVAR